MKIILMLFTLSVSLSCSKSVDIEKTKLELANVERTFSAMSVDKGFYEALRAYKADDVMFFRDRPVTDSAEINKMLSRNFPGTVTWEPMFCDVSASGDLGYTYGPARFVVKDSAGQETVMKSYYMTIWKKQADGSWKYVMDTGTQPKPEEKK